MMARPQLMTAADPRSAFGTLLKRHRLRAGLTHESLAERAGLSSRTISDLERGVSRRPHRDTLELLVQALEISPAERSTLQSAAWAAGIGPADLTSSGDDAGSVPVHLTSFIGRDEEMRQTSDRLRRGVRMLTLTGAGGSGKSRLAARVARDLMHEFRDGARYVELAPVTHADDVLPAIARALGVARADAASVRMADTVARVGDRQQLLVVDNFEHLLSSGPVISELLQGCPGLVIVVTSRASLQLSGEHELTIAPLAVPPTDPLLTTDAIGEYASVRLFVDRAKSIKPAFVLNDDNASAVAAICARLDGLPLALELAAARIKMLTAPALLQRLDRADSGSALRLLTRTARDVPPRQRTLRDTMLWSYNLLLPAEQRLLRQLSIFAGGCTLPAAEVVCESDDSEIARGVDRASAIFDGLASLLDKSLIYLHEGPDGEQRFMLLETVREFGLDELRATGELEAVARAHATYYLQLIEATGALLFAGVPKQRRSAAEQHNLRDALRWLLHHG